MRILYGVVGEGMGHATRSCVVLEHLLAAGHDLRVVVSGRAHKFLVRRFADRPGIRLEEIHGLHMDYRDNAFLLAESVLTNLEVAPDGILKNLDVYRRVAEDGFRPDLVISDFESWAYLYGLRHRIPVVCIDNQHVINRCRHPAPVLAGAGADFPLAAAAVHVKVAGAYHYLVTSFFFPEVRKKRTTLVPPILRPEILAARREPGSHVLVYQTASSNRPLVPLLQKLPGEFRVYGMGREGTEGNVTLRQFSDTGFVEDLRTARALISGGGFSLMSEAVHLRVPTLSFPLDNQFEQELNARWLGHLGYGAWATSMDADTVADFLGRTDEYAGNLSRGYLPRDNAMLFGCVDELARYAELGEPRPAFLHSHAMGKYEGPLHLDELPQEW
jgi:uncharacterized protein (TIGR00661 family)